MGHGPGLFTAEGFLRGNRLTRRKNFARGRSVGNVATTSTSRTFCKMAMGGVSVTMQSTTVKRAIEYMPKTRSGLVGDGEVPEIVDLCAEDDDVPGPSRRYGGFSLLVF